MGRKPRSPTDRASRLRGRSQHPEAGNRAQPLANAAPQPARAAPAAAAAAARPARAAAPPAPAAPQPAPAAPQPARAAPQPAPAAAPPAPGPGGPAPAAPQPAAAPPLPPAPASIPIANSVSQMLIAPQVPDQTSYAGVTYFDLALGSDVLVIPISIDRSGNPINANTVPTAAYMGGTGSGSAPAAASATANVRSNAALRTRSAPTPSMVLAVEGNGGITHPPQFALILLSPSSKQTINGPNAGVTVKLSGEVLLDLGDELTTLNYSLDGAAAVAINLALVGDYSLSFTASVQIVASGTHNFVVRASRAMANNGMRRLSSRLISQTAISSRTRRA